MNTILYMPDGNRRFARKKQISLDEAYCLGGKTLRLFSDFFVVGGISKKFIFHVMSDYTHERTDSSLGPIYEALGKTFDGLAKEEFFESNGIRFRWVDHSGKLPEKVKKVCRVLSEATKNLDDGEVVALLGYSLEKDINQALSKNPIDYNSFRKNLIFLENIDLVIRPYEMRPSGGPVYAMSQAQMITLDKLNPEVRKEDLEKILGAYSTLKSYRISSSHNPYHKS